MIRVVVWGLFFSFSICSFIVAEKRKTEIGSTVIAIGKSKKSVAITHDSSNNEWEVGTSICIYQGVVDLVCGKVVKTFSKGAIALLDDVFEGISVGDGVRKQKNKVQADKKQNEVKTKITQLASQKKIERKPASLLHSLDSLTPTSISNQNSLSSFSVSSTKRKWNFTGGLGTGVQFLAPFLQVQLAVTERIAIAILPRYFYGPTHNDQVPASGLGGIVAMHFYLDQVFHGLQLMFGGGIYSFLVSYQRGNTQTEETLVIPVGMAAVGWTWLWKNGFTLGLGLGLEYAKDPEFTDRSLVLKTNSMRGIAILELGFTL